MHPGKAISRYAISILSVLWWASRCARGVGAKKQESSSTTSFHYSRAKQESFLVRTCQFT